MPFDGHFWVIRDGKVIDKSFPEWDMVISINKLDRKKQIYLPADDMTQRLWKQKCQKEYLTEDFSALDWTPRYGWCYQNALHEIAKNGGELVFGSMGWKFKSCPKVHYEFGGIGWTLMDFAKKNPLNLQGIGRGFHTQNYEKSTIIDKMSKKEMVKCFIE